jgi:hypothetical protein
MLARSAKQPKPGKVRAMAWLVGVLVDLMLKSLEWAKSVEEDGLKDKLPQVCGEYSFGSGAELVIWGLAVVVLIFWVDF